MEQKTLANLKPAKGSNKAKKRLGRGPGSGLGKTSGKGHKGQRARKGGGIRPGFEGGQMPLYRRLPKRGFSNPFTIHYNEINLEKLAKFSSDAVVTPEELKKAGLLGKLDLPIKLLGRGELKQKLTIHVHKASAAAKAAVEQAGGKLELITVERKPVVKNKARK